MSRFKWYRASWPINVFDLGRRLRNYPFQDDSGDGFVLDRIQNGMIEGRYVERLNVRDETIDPFGGQLEFHRVEFRQARFRLSDSEPGLELIGSSRGSLVLANKLAEAADYQLAISSYQIDVLKWISLFQNETGIAGFIDAMQIGSIDMGRGITARTIIRGREDVRDAAKLLIQDRNSVVEKIQYKFSESRKESVTLSHFASAVIKVADSENISSAIRSTINSAISELN